MAIGCVAAGLALAPGPVTAAPPQTEAPVYGVRPAAGGLWLITPEGQPLVDLYPTLMRRSADGPPVVERLVGGGIRSTADGGWTSTAALSVEGTRYEWTVGARPGDARLVFSLRADYAAPTAVSSEAVRLQISDVGLARALDRAYRQRTVERAQFTGQLTPHAVDFGRGPRAFAIRGGAGVQGMWVRPDTGGAFTVDLELDDHRNRPFARYARCVDAIEPMRRVPLDVMRRRAGERAELSGEIIVGERVRLLPARLPDGFAAALAFTDHADQSDAARLEAFAFGRTGALRDGAVGPTHPGFVNRGLRYTKSIFAQRVGRYAPQFESDAYRRVLAAMARRGVEIATHSPTGERDVPDQLPALLDAQASTHPLRTWIDHQPETNCEAIANRGWDPRSEWHVLDALRRLGIRTLWATHDTALPAGSLNLLDPAALGDRRPLFFEHPAFPGFRLFESAWMYRARGAFVGLFDPPILDALEAQWGISVGHVYLDTHRAQGRLAPRSLLAARGAGFALRPEVDAMFRRLAARQSAGRLWVCGVDELVHHTAAALDVRIDFEPDGGARLVSGRPVSGLTMLVPTAGGAEVWLDGELQSPLRMVNGLPALVLDLARGRPRRIVLRDDAGMRPFVHPAHIIPMSSARVEPGQ